MSQCAFPNFAQTMQIMANAEAGCVAATACVEYLSVHLAWLSARRFIHHTP
jgi:hypothetical protein